MNNYNNNHYSRNNNSNNNYNPNRNYSSNGNYNYNGNNNSNYNNAADYRNNADDNCCDSENNRGNFDENYNNCDDTNGHNMENMDREREKDQKKDKDKDKDKDKGANPYAANIWRMAVQNRNFRTTIWTGCNLQMTLMSIPPREDIGAEVHEDSDQYIRVEQGYALVRMKNCENEREYVQRLSQGDGVFVPAGTKHNIINIGRMSLKLSSVYAPPQHKPGTIHQTKEEAEKEEQCD